MAKLDEFIPKTLPEGWRVDWRRQMGEFDLIMFVNADGLNVSASYEPKGSAGKPCIHTTMSRRTARPTDIEIYWALYALFPTLRATPRVIEQVTGLHQYTVHVQVPLS